MPSSQPLITKTALPVHYTRLILCADLDALQSFAMVKEKILIIDELRHV